MWSADFDDVDTQALFQAVATKGETFLRGWSLIFINEYHQEQDRVFILTDQACYRVRFNFKDRKVNRFQRVPLQDIYCIQRGFLLISGETNSGHFGFRIFNKEASEEHVNPHFRTYRPSEDTNERVNEIVDAISEAIKQITNTDVVEDVASITLSPLPLFSKAHNALGLGRQKRNNSTNLINGSKGSAKKGELTDSVDHPLKDPLNVSGYGSSSSDESGLSTKPNNNTVNESLPPQDLFSSTDSPPKVIPPQPVSSSPITTTVPPSTSTLSGSPVTPSIVPSSTTVSTNESANTVQTNPVPISTVSTSDDSARDSSQQLIQQQEPDTPISATTTTTPSPPKPAATTNHVNWVLLLFQKMDMTGHLLLCVLSAFFFGYFNFSFLWALILMFLVYRIDYYRQEKQFKIEQRKKKRQLLPQNNKWARQKPSDPENCNWFNVLLVELWPHMSRSIAITTREKLKSLLEWSMNQKKPTAVESITISEINFGNIPPTIKNVTAVKPPFPDCRIEFDIAYKGPAQILVEVILGGKFVNLKVPIAINEFDIKGRMRFELTFYAKSPFLHTLSYAFISQPQIDISIKALKTIDVMEVPFLKESMEDSLRTLIATTLVLPEHIVIPYHLWYATDGIESGTGTGPNASSIPFVGFGEYTRQEDLERHAIELEHSKKNDEYAGLLHVRVLEARKLTLVGSKDSTPYCIITTGPHEIFTTNAVKRVKNPVWNEFFELLVKKNRARKLEVTVMARDAVNGDDFLGMAIVDFSDFGKETKELWAKLESTNKKGMTVVAGEIHLQIRFVPPPERLLDDEEDG